MVDLVSRPLDWLEEDEALTGESEATQARASWTLRLALGKGIHHENRDHWLAQIR